jgi:hypothetical protein
MTVPVHKTDSARSQMKTARDVRAVCVSAKFVTRYLVPCNVLTDQLESPEKMGEMHITEV